MKKRNNPHSLLITRYPLFIINYQRFHRLFRQPGSLRNLDSTQPQ